MKIANMLFVTTLLFGTVAGLPFFGSHKTEPIEPVRPIDRIQDEETEFGPVADMHHFMEFISKPGYRELKAIFAEEEIRRSTWRKVQQHSLILAESSILVVDRPPADADDEVKAEWRAFSLETYNAAAALYAAAGEKNKDEALKQYGLMLDGCNKCHSEYDENDHQLER